MFQANQGLHAQRRVGDRVLHERDVEPTALERLGERSDVLRLDLGLEVRVTREQSGHRREQEEVGQARGRTHPQRTTELRVAHHLGALVHQAHRRAHAGQQHVATFVQLEASLGAIEKGMTQLLLEELDGSRHGGR